MEHLILHYYKETKVIEICLKKKKKENVSTLRSNLALNGNFYFLK